MLIKLKNKIYEINEGKRRMLVDVRVDDGIVALLNEYKESGFFFEAKPTKYRLEKWRTVARLIMQAVDVIASEFEVDIDDEENTNLNALSVEHLKRIKKIIRPRKKSMGDISAYAEGWNDCLKELDRKFKLFIKDLSK